jgi:YegS/Rv2252/BmrU family lipid kinase
MDVNLKKILFIVNPIAGGKDKGKFRNLLKSTIPADFEYKVIYWDDPMMDFKSAINDNCDPDTGIIAAVGGDGTVNRVAAELVYTERVMAIIPYGSGNGIARHLSIPLNTKRAIQLLMAGKVETIDACEINGKHFFTSAGVGFDAHISQLFSGSAKRGFFTYFKLVMKSFFSYKSKKYNIEIDGKKIKERAFLLTIANANQFGNNAIIAPNASLKDGLLDIVIMKRPNLFQSLILIIRLFSGTINKSRLIREYKATKVTLKRKKKGFVHYDGEHDTMKKKITIKINPKALNVMVGGKVRL